MSYVFISYAHKDKARANELANAFELSRIPLWWDPQIQLGAPFSPAIMQALEEASAIVVLWSWASVRSSWVLEEASFAAQRGVLIPVLLDETRPPAEFAHLDCANLSDWNSRKPHTEYDFLRRTLLSISREGGSRRSTGYWQVERLNKETLRVQLDREQHTVQYSRGLIYIDGHKKPMVNQAVTDKRKYSFELSDGGQFYYAELTVWVTLLRGDVKKMALQVGGTALYEG